MSNLVSVSMSMLMQHDRGMNINARITRDKLTEAHTEMHMRMDGQNFADVGLLRYWTIPKLENL